MAIRNLPKSGGAPSPNQVLPETNVGRLNELYKTLGIQGDTSNIGATSADKMAAYPAQRVQGALGDVLKRENPNIANAQRAYADITRNTIDPLTAGPMGVVAGKTGFDAGAPSPVPRVTSVLSNADIARPENIRPLYTAMNQVDPTAFPGMARTWLQNAFDKATQRIQSGDNRMMGANFAKTVYGTDQEQQNLQEVLRGVANAHGVDPERFVDGADKLMQTLEATGKVPGIGSPTSSRGELQKQLSKNPYSAVTDVPGILKTIASKIADKVNTSRNEQIARILTAPDSVQQIAKMAKLNPNGLTARYYAAALLGLDKAAAAQ